MDVVQVCPEILLIADHMIPETSLPEIKGLLNVVYDLVISGEISFDAVKYSGEVPGRMIHFDQPMKVIGQDDICKEFKWMDFIDFFQCSKEEFDVRF